MARSRKEKDDLAESIVQIIQNILDMENGTEYEDDTLGEQPFTYPITNAWKIRRIEPMVRMLNPTCKDLPGTPRVEHAWNKRGDGWKCQHCGMEAK